MSPRIASGAAVVAGVVAFLIVFSVSLRFPLTIPLKTDRQALLKGYYSVEANRERVFAWTGPHAEFALPTLDRRTDWRVTHEIRMGRPPGVPPPNVRIAVDGATVADRVVKGNDFLDVTAPRRPGARGLTISLDTTPTFSTSRDARKLGVAISSVTLAPIEGTPHAPWQTVARGAAAIAILTAAVAALQLPRLWVAVFGILAACGQAALLARGVGPYVQYPSRVLALAVGLATGLLAVVWVVENRRKQALSAAAIGAAVISLAACYLKLLMLLHPNMPIGDGLFHAHRFEYVLAGRFYFTSLTPDNYAFPYPIFLYLSSAPFAWLTSDSLERLALLRIVATVADAAAATLLYWMIVRATSDRLAGLGAVVWYHAIPMTAWILTEGALTNAFAQTLFVASLALVVALPVEWTRRSTVAILTVVVAAALLTHPSTCAILVGVLAATGVLYAWRGGTLRPAAMGVVLAAAAASAIAVVLYYAWFPSVYVSELGRAASVSVSGASAPVRSVGARLANAARLGDVYFGWPAVVTAAIGVWHLWRRGESPQLALLLVAWGGICLMFLAIGIVTPIEMRYHFAAFPALAIAAAFGCSWGWRSRSAVSLAVSALLLAGVWDGVAQWMWAMTTYARTVR